jgi:hypothetical protein
MEDPEKIKLFRKGAEAAIRFLREFDWDAYKSERLANANWMEERFDNPNNLEAFPFSAVKMGQKGPANG